MYCGYAPYLAARPFISSFSMESLGILQAANQGTAPGSSTWISANRTVYAPVIPTQSITVKRMFCLNGATVGTDTITVAIYSSDSTRGPVTRLVTASALSAGTASQCQYFDITDTVLGAGQLYFMALAFSGTTATVFRAATGIGTTALATVSFFTENSNCPATATPVPGVGAFYPVFGLDLRGSP